MARAAAIAARCARGTGFDRDLGHRPCGTSVPPPDRVATGSTDTRRTGRSVRIAADAAGSPGAAVAVGTDGATSAASATLASVSADTTADHGLVHLDLTDAERDQADRSTTGTATALAATTTATAAATTGTRPGRVEERRDALRACRAVAAELTVATVATVTAVARDTALDRRRRDHDPVDVEQRHADRPVAAVSARPRAAASPSGTAPPGRS